MISARDVNGFSAVQHITEVRPTLRDRMEQVAFTEGMETE
jgi:hypothetical protein